MGVCCSSKSMNKVLEVSDSKYSLGITSKTFISLSEKSLIDIYKIGPCIGTGSFGEVRLATHRETGQERAVKIFRKANYSSRNSLNKMQNELVILKDVDHPNIIRLFEYYEDQRKFYMVMEKCDGGELYDQIAKINSFSELQAALIIKQLVTAVAYLHQNHIMHRDIKPENILFEEKDSLETIKLIDFGLACKFTQNSFATDILGTAYYISPEVLKGRYNEKCDIWSCGVIAYIILCGEAPFNAENDLDIVEKIKKGKFTFNLPIWSILSSESKDFISALLVPEASRPSASECLHLPWLSSLSSQSPCKELYISTLKSLQNFNSKYKLKEAVRAFIATQFISHQERKDLTHAFQAIDKDGDGKISREELKTHYIKVTGDEGSEESVEKIMNELDYNHSGSIGYSDFLKACVSQTALTVKENLKAAFNRFDKDGNGRISAEEIKLILQDGRQYKEAVWSDILHENDLDFDGEIDFDEFCSMFA